MLEHLNSQIFFLGPNMFDCGKKKFIVLLTAEHQRPLKDIFKVTREIIKTVHKEKDNNK